MESNSTGSITQLVRLVRIIHRRSTVELLGLRLKDFATLAFLRDEEAAGRTTTQQGLIESLCIDANTCVLLLNDLESEDLVERHRDPQDRRRHVVNITDIGRHALEQAEAAQASIEDEILAGLTKKQRQELHALLVRALDSHKT